MGLALIVEKEKRVYGPWQTLIQAEFLILHFLRFLKRKIIIIIMPNSTMLMTTPTLHGTQTQSPLHHITRFKLMILLLMEKDMIQVITLVIWCNLIIIIIVYIILRLTWRMCSMVYLPFWLAGTNFRVSFQISSR